LIAINVLTLRAFLVSCGFGRTRNWPASVKFNAADDMQFRVSVFYGLRDSIDNRILQYGECASLDSKMGTKVVGTLTHADAPQRGNAPHSAPHPACFYHTLQ
jgi:hypothetical protein